MQNDKNKSEKSMTLTELQREIEKQKAIIAAKERGASAEEIEEIQNSTPKDSLDDSKNDSEKSEEPKKATALQKIGKIAYVVFAVILALILFINVWLIISRTVFKNPNPTFCGLGYFRVTTWSMEGDEPDSIKKGSLVFTVKQKEYEVGDVVTFLSDRDIENSVTTPTTHRIIEITEDGSYKTKGDNPVNTPDIGSLGNDNIIGKVYLTVPKVGDFVNYMQTTRGLIIITAVCIGFILIPLLFGRYDDDEEEQ